MPMSPGGLGALSGLGQGLSNLAPMYMQMQARKQNLAQREKELERQRDRDNFTRLANVFNMQVKLGDMEGAERTVQQFQGIEPEADYANLNYKGREKEYYADLNKILTNYRENSVQNPREAEQTLLDETGVLNAKYGFRREYTEEKVEEQRGLLQREEQRLQGLEREQRDILRTGRFETGTAARGRLEPLTTLGTPGPGTGVGIGQPGLGPPDIQVPGQEGVHAVPEVATETAAEKRRLDLEAKKELKVAPRAAPQVSPKKPLTLDTVNTRLKALETGKVRLQTTKGLDPMTLAILTQDASPEKIAEIKKTLEVQDISSALKEMDKQIKYYNDLRNTLGGISGRSEQTISQLTKQYPPTQHKGRIIVDKQTGTRYESDGTSWKAL